MVLKSELIKSISQMLNELTIGQLQRIHKLIKHFKLDGAFRCNPKSDLINQNTLEQIGDALMEHHSLSHQPFTKDRLEYLLEHVLTENGILTIRSTAGKAGEDLFIRGVPASVKTEAEKSIKVDTIHISKFRELGKGEWIDKVEHLEGLCQQFFEHMKNYERILTLRCLRTHLDKWHYELVEIPKSLLMEAKNGEFKICVNSKQMPKPGYCYVYSETTDTPAPRKNLKFALYFDGGGERKLQIKSLNKAFCTVHAEWIFPQIK